MSDKKYYTVKAVFWNFDEAKERIGIKLEVTEGPEVGKSGWYNGSLSEGWAERTIEAMKLLGWDGSDWENFTGLGTTLATGVMVQEEWPKGTIKEVFKYVNQYKPKASGGSGPKTAAPSKKFLAKYKALAQSVQVEIDPSARITAETADDPF